jgi:hypothetical protein
MTKRYKSTGGQGEVDDIEDDIAESGGLTRLFSKLAIIAWKMLHGWRAPKENDDG